MSNINCPSLAIWAVRAAREKIFNLNVKLNFSELHLIIYSLIMIYVSLNNSEYFGGEFSISIFLLVSMLEFDSFVSVVDITYFHSGSTHFQIATKQKNKIAKTPCIFTTLSTLFISSIESQIEVPPFSAQMVATNNNTIVLMMKY